MKKLTTIALLLIFSVNQLTEIASVSADALRAAASCKCDSAMGEIKSALSKYSSGSYSDIRYDKMRKVKNILENRPPYVKDLGRLFDYLIDKTRILDAPESLEEKYDSLLSMLSQLEAEDFRDKGSCYIIEQAYQMLLEDEPAIVPESGALEYILWMGRKIDFFEKKMSVQMIDLRFRNQSEMIKTVKLDIITPAEYPIIRPENLESNIISWQGRREHFPHFKNNRESVIRYFFSEDQKNEIWIGNKGGYSLALRAFYSKRESKVLARKGYLARIRIRPPTEDFILPPDPAARNSKSSSAGVTDPLMEEFLIEKVYLQGNKLTAVTKNNTTYELEADGAKMIREELNISPDIDTKGLSAEKIERVMFIQLLGHEDTDVVNFALKYSKRELAKYLTWLSQLYRRSGDYEWSSEYSEMALKQYLIEGKKDEAFASRKAFSRDLLLLIGGYYNYYRPLVKAERLKKEATLFELLGGKKKAARRFELASRDYNKIASMISDKTKAMPLYAESAFCAEEAARLDEECGNEENQATNLSFAARNRLLAGEHNKAYDAIIKAIELDVKLKKPKFDKFEMIDRDIAANICYRLGKYSESVEHGLRSLDLRHQLKLDPLLTLDEKSVIGKDEAGSTALLGFSYFKGRQYVFAIVHLQKAIMLYRDMLNDRALKDYERLKKRAFVLKMLSFLASSYFQEKQYDSAISRAAECIKLIEESQLLCQWNGVDKTREMAHSILTDSCSKKGDPEKAIESGINGVRILLAIGSQA